MTGLRGDHLRRRHGRRPAGAVAAHTTLPVIGVPLSGGALNGVDALYATVQMPRGIPVASVAIDGAANAALLAVEILAVTDPGLAAKLAAFRAQWAPPAPLAPPVPPAPEPARGRGAIVIPRYSRPEMAALFTDEARFAAWLEVEVLAVEAWASLGVVPADEARQVRERAPVVDAALVTAVLEREAVTDHDVAAFVDVVQDRIGGRGGPLGPLRADLLRRGRHRAVPQPDPGGRPAARGVGPSWSRRSGAGPLSSADTPMVGRTHGIHAEPTTFGAKLALWALQADRDRRRLRAARQADRRGQAVGRGRAPTPTSTPRWRHAVCRALGLMPVPATQVIARDRHAEYLWACASVGATIELMATEIRHLQRTEVREVEEPFGAGQKGSSAMPHKRNPIKSEQLSGLARVLRGYLGAGLEDVALWHERDISHSSVERIILPDASMLAYYMLVQDDGPDRRAGRPPRPDAGELRPDPMAWCSASPCCWPWSRAGLTRDEAYRIVQRDAMARLGRRTTRSGRAGGGPRGDASTRLTRWTRPSTCAASLRHADRVIDALDRIPTVPMKESS